MISIESEERPWGRFFVMPDESTFNLKRIEVDSGGRLSYQYYYKRSEAWTIVEDIETITLDGEAKEYKVGQTILILQGVKHPIEVQTSTYFGEDDIARIEYYRT